VNETIFRDVKLRAFVRRDTDERWVAVCPSLDVASQGVSPDDAKRCLDEAVQLWFESCLERGTLERALQELNFRPQFRVIWRSSGSANRSPSSRPEFFEYTRRFQHDSERSSER
jgi:predicted RNase H-like HicB family nuclease